MEDDTSPSFESSIGAILGSMYQYQYEAIRGASEACVYAVVEVINHPDEKDVEEVVTDIINRIPDSEEKQTQYWRASITFLTLFYYDVHSLVKIMIGATFDSVSGVLTNEEFRSIIVSYLLRTMYPSKEAKPQKQADAGKDNIKGEQNDRKGRKDRNGRFALTDAEEAEENDDDDEETIERNTKDKAEKEKSNKKVKDTEALLVQVYDNMIRCATENPETGDLYPARGQVVATLKFLNSKITDSGLSDIVGTMNSAISQLKLKYAVKDKTNMQFRIACSDIIEELRMLRNARNELQSKINEKKKNKKKGGS